VRVEAFEDFETGDDAPMPERLSVMVLGGNIDNLVSFLQMWREQFSTVNLLALYLHFVVSERDIDKWYGNGAGEGNRTLVSGVVGTDSLEHRRIAFRLRHLFSLDVSAVTESMGSRWAQWTHPQAGRQICSRVPPLCW
jgi:hypothetical protein